MLSTAERNQKGPPRKTVKDIEQISERRAEESVEEEYMRFSKLLESFNLSSEEQELLTVRFFNGYTLDQIKDHQKYRNKMAVSRAIKHSLKSIKEKINAKT